MSNIIQGYFGTVFPGIDEIFLCTEEGVVRIFKTSRIMRKVIIPDESSFSAMTVEKYHNQILGALKTLALQGYIVAVNLFKGELNTDTTRKKFAIMLEGYTSQLNKQCREIKILCDESNNTPKIIDNHDLVVTVSVRIHTEVSTFRIAIYSNSFAL